jgi:hypothetical protein
MLPNLPEAMEDGTRTGRIPTGCGLKLSPRQDTIKTSQLVPERSIHFSSLLHVLQSPHILLNVKSTNNEVPQDTLVTSSILGSNIFLSNHVDGLQAGRPRGRSCSPGRV